jgi:acyl carrier protein phosphodiesterase
MNFLAHAYLSFHHPGILTGNMISDFVKGKKRYDYPPEIQRGISLHRSIDHFTDGHDATRKAKIIFRPDYRLYDAAIVDVVFDHFLANDESVFDDESLLNFTKDTYVLLDGYIDYFPEKFSRMYPYMKMQNWLYHYRHRQGIEKSLAGLVRRSLYMKESETAFRLFNENFEYLQQCYHDFFPAVKKMALDFIAHENPEKDAGN